MGTTVRLREQDKEKLEKLKALVTLSTGKKVTQEELLGVLLNDALARGENFLPEIFGEKFPLSDREFQKIKGLISDWGVETSWREIDEILYNPPGKKSRTRWASS